MTSTRLISDARLESIAASAGWISLSGLLCLSNLQFTKCFPDSRQGLFLCRPCRLVDTTIVANPNPEHRLWPKVVLDIDN